MHSAPTARSSMAGLAFDGNLCAIAEKGPGLVSRSRGGCEGGRGGLEQAPAAAVGLLGP